MNTGPMTLITSVGQHHSMSAALTLADKLWLLWLIQATVTTDEVRIVWHCFFCHHCTSFCPKMDPQILQPWPQWGFHYQEISASPAGTLSTQWGFFYQEFSAYLAGTLSIQWDFRYQDIHLDTVNSFGFSLPRNLCQPSGEHCQFSGVSFTRNFLPTWRGHH